MNDAIFRFFFYFST
ncbi:TPA: pheST operon leader peptide PheM [Enterobacter hormaechei]